MFNHVHTTTLVAALLLAVPHAVRAESDTDEAALAAQYEQEAKDLRAQADRHRRMLKAYDGPKYSKVQQGPNLRSHCTKLILEFDAAAANAEALAKEHRAAAGAAAGTAAPTVTAGATGGVAPDENDATLATQYEQEAARLREQAERHRRMLKAYDGPTYSKVQQGPNLRSHCQKLIDEYETAAANAESLAKAHRAAATQQ
jgi:hypothetical protein